MKLAAVEAEGLVVHRGDRRVLHGVDFTVAACAITGLLGPSGCGKTTLLRAVVGVQRISQGRVTVLGREAGDPVLRRKIGYVTQAPSVYGDLTVAENVQYFAAIAGSPASAARQALADVGLSDRAGTVVRALSGGQRARVSLASALLMQPLLLVLDEPTVGLDPVLRRDLWVLFQHLVAGGTTLLVSSHVMDEAGRCDHLLLLREGQILASKSPSQLRAETGTQDLEQAFLRLVEPAKLPA